MGQVLHGSATTTEAIRRAIQHSKESLRALARRHGINQKTVAKWEKRSSAADLRTGPKDPRSTSLTIEEEAVVVTFRRHTLLPLDDCLYALQATIPHLTRSSLHRCLQRHGISRLPTSMATSLPERSSRPIRSATSTLIWRRYGPNRASSICWWPSIGPRSSRSWSCTRRQLAGSPVTFCGISRQLYRTGSIRCSPTMERISLIRPAMAGRPRTSRKCGRRNCRFVVILLNWPAPISTSNTASPSRGILGQTARSSG